ncbi:MAG: hypothetical protein WCA19_17740 [Candidatus Acidiferrales bacterium]
MNQRSPIRGACSIVIAGMLVFGSGCQRSANQQKSKNIAVQQPTQPAAGANPTLQSAASTVQVPQVPTAADAWNQASPSMRRSILAGHIRKTWKNVRVENSGSIMTITHPGMDENGARQMIDDIGTLAESAGVKRINFVRAGGMCQVTYERPYCEIAGSIPGDDETGGTGCGPYEGHSGDGWTSTIHTAIEPCQPHTWVYDVPRQ